VSAELRNYWHGCARRAARRFNFGWWLQMFRPWLVGTGVAAAIAVLALRSAQAPVLGAGILAGLAALAGAIYAWARARRHFLSEAEALVRLDGDLQLKNLLTSAEEGVGGWPRAREDARLALEWRWTQLLWPPAALVALVLAALAVPLPESSQARQAATAEPPAWKAVQEKLDALKRNEVVQEPAVQEFQKSLDALRRQSPDQWFRHESLEAGDHLQTQMDQSLADLAKNLETAQSALEAARQAEPGQLQTLGQPLDAALQAALQNLEAGKLPLDAQTLGQLKNLDVSKARQLSEAEWKKLSERLKACAGTCSSGYKDGKGDGEALLAALGSQPGAGGVDRGPGAAPLTMKDQETQLGTTKTEEVKNGDLSRATIGDTMGLSSGRHKVDESQWKGSQAGGGMAAAGSGGDAVWGQAATPAEQEALRQFFH